MFEKNEELFGYIFNIHLSKIVLNFLFLVIIFSQIIFVALKQLHIRDATIVSVHQQNTLHPCNSIWLTYTLSHCISCITLVCQSLDPIYLQGHIIEYSRWYDMLFKLKHTMIYMHKNNLSCTVYHCCRIMIWWNIKDKLQIIELAIFIYKFHCLLHVCLIHNQVFLYSWICHATKTL